MQQVALAGAQVTYQYDAAGNVTQENGSRHFQWDAADQLRQFATWTGAGSAPTLLAYYLYSGGQRVKKLTQTSADTWQVTIYAEGGFEHRYEVSQGSLAGEQTQVAMLDDQHRLYQRRSGDALGDQRPDKLYALDDHLGSAAAQTDAGGQLVSREEYYPFGETSFGSTAKQRYRFCGKELDEESGLYYYGMRYYAAWLCRFISVDPLAAKYAFYTPYQYAGNKPINATDLDGAEEKPVVDSGGQGSPANLGRPSQAAPQDATRRAPPARTVPVHNVSLTQQLSSARPQSQNDAVMGPSAPADVQQAYNTNGILAQNRKKIAGSDPFVGGGEANNPFGFASTFTTAVKETPLFLATEGLSSLAETALMARSLRAARDAGRAARAAGNTVSELAPGARSAVSQGYASYGEKFGDIMANVQPFNPKPKLPNLDLTGKMGKLAQHAPDWGHGVKGQIKQSIAGPAMESEVKNIMGNYEEIRVGNWMNPNDGGAANAYFVRRGSDAVVMDSNGLLITVIRNMLGNKHFNNATSIWLK